MQKTHPLRMKREALNLTRERLAEQVGIGAATIKRAERGESISPDSRQRLCAFFGCSSEGLGLLKGSNEPGDGFLVRDDGMVLTSTRIENPLPTTLFEIGVEEILDNAESIIDLAWEAWFASRPAVVARSVSKLLPNLEKITHSSGSRIQQLRATELEIRAHGVLGCVSLDALHYDTALFHFMQSHRFSEEAHDTDLTATYLCLVGEVLRQQKDQAGSLRYMENARERAMTGASKATRGHILQLLAYAYGDTGQETAFERTISEATNLLAFSGQGKDAAQKEFIPFELYEIRGKVCRDLGKPLDGLPYLDLAEASLAAADTVTPRWNALLEISRAQVYCDAGDVQGIELACKGFMKAYQCRSLHQMNRVRKLLKKLEHGPFRNHPRVQDLKNLLSETYLRLGNEEGYHNPLHPLLSSVPTSISLREDPDKDQSRDRLLMVGIEI